MYERNSSLPLFTILTPERSQSKSSPGFLGLNHQRRPLKTIKPGGHFITEGYHKTQMEMTSGGPKNLDLLWDLDELLEELSKGFEIVHAAVEETILEESELHSGLAHVVRIHLRRVTN